MVLLYFNSFCGGLLMMVVVVVFVVMVFFFPDKLWLPRWW